MLLRSTPDRLKKAPVDIRRVVLSHNPWPKKRLRGAQAAGLRYEKKAAKEIKRLFPSAKASPWFEYVASNCSGMCSPDIVLPVNGVVYVFECKLTDTPYAEQQLYGLYMPVAEAFYKKPARGIIVARHLTKTSDTDRVVITVADALSRSHEMPILHYLGRRLPK
jgi:hypothetical protein